MGIVKGSALMEQARGGAGGGSGVGGGGPGGGRQN